MVQIPGILTVKTVTGRYGDFNVATLECDLGHFSVRDAILDEYNEGRYEGTFGIKRIYASSYNARHRLVIETRAELNGIWLQDYQEGHVPNESPMEEDPLALERKAQQQLNQERESLQNAIPSPSPQPPEEDRESDALAQLFGELWPLPSKVGDALKLNPEIGREKMRQQLNYIRRLVNGDPVWKFEPRAQSWIRLREDSE